MNSSLTKFLDGLSQSFNPMHLKSTRENNKTERHKTQQKYLKKAWLSWINMNVEINSKSCSHKKACNFIHLDLKKQASGEESLQVDDLEAKDGLRITHR